MLRSVVMVMVIVATEAISLRASFLKQIREGSVAVATSFIKEEEVNALQDLCQMLHDKGFFMESGLTYDSDDNGERNGGKGNERLVCDEIPQQDEYDCAALEDVISKIDSLRRHLSIALNRPSMADDNLPHESYLSLSPPGALLNRHVDERHEELNMHPWSQCSRRSLSWLLYLNENPYTRGGELRYFSQCLPMYSSVFGTCGVDQSTGDVQIGWLSYKHLVKPVYMKAQLHREEKGQGKAGKKRIVSSLYIKSVFRKCVYISSEGFTAHEEDGGDDGNDNESSERLNFLEKCVKSMKSHYMQYKFSLIEDMLSWKTNGQLAPNGSVSKTIIPSGATLVVFDSISVPHEVLQVTATHVCESNDDNGNDDIVEVGVTHRLALGGWFHELNEY